jgi:hypothetical protein
VPTTYAEDFSQILPVLSREADLRDAVLRLVENNAAVGKILDGAGRLAQHRLVMKRLVAGQTLWTQALREAESQLSPTTSPHGGDRRVFPSGWRERYLRTQLSRYYNQAVMELLIADGRARCFVPHSRDEDPSTRCSTDLANRDHDLVVFHRRLVDGHERNRWSSDPTIPDHPHCTHVVRPTLQKGP